MEKAYGRQENRVDGDLHGEKAAEFWRGRLVPQETLTLSSLTWQQSKPADNTCRYGLRSPTCLCQSRSVPVCDLCAGLRRSSLPAPGDTNMVIFRENSEDIYAGIEYQADLIANKVVDFLINEMGATKTPQNAGIGIKPVSS